MALRKYALLIGEWILHSEKAQTELASFLDSEDIQLHFVSCKDAALAANTVDKQKLDFIFVDAEAPRMKEGDLLRMLKSHKNAASASVFVASANEQKDLPLPLPSYPLVPKPTTSETLITQLKESLRGVGTAAACAQGFAVDARVINAIISSTSKVVSQLGISELKMDKPYSKEINSPLAGEIWSVIDIDSKIFQGRFAISFDKGSFLQILSGMMGAELDDLSDEDRQAVGEINNIIYGNAKPDLTQYGVKMTIPKVLKANSELKHPVGARAMVIPFATPKGKFTIDVFAYPVKKSA